MENLNDLLKKYRGKYGKYNRIFIRSSETFSLNDRSIDFPSEHGYRTNMSKKEIEELIEEYELDASPIKTKKFGWSIHYFGVNASETYSEQIDLIFSGAERLYIFLGEPICENLCRDGYIVKPEQILAILDSDFNIKKQ
ncbi:MAG: hypothetical protein GF311_21530 [Candidatus Lokiarchaeota archaeon]|nr:hypothetical protein [Candidatus Lokiarchaeota archaeon]